MPAFRPVLVAIVAAVAFSGAPRAADPAGPDFAAAKRDAQAAVKSNQLARRQGAFERLAEIPTAESVDTMIRLELKAKDEPTRSAARRGLAVLAGVSMATDGVPSASAIDPEAAADVRRHLHELLDRELKGKALPGAVAIGVAAALLAAEDPASPESLFAILDGGGVAKGAPLCWGIATAAAVDDDAKRSAAANVGALVAAGKTASFDALDTAFRYDAEAIFFLSDGEPTAGRMVNPAHIVRFVAEANKNRRLSLHTIGIMPDNGLAQVLQVLATSNNGAYRHVAD